MDKTVVMVVKPETSEHTIQLITALRDPEGGSMLKGTQVTPSLVDGDRVVLITGRFDQSFSVDGLAKFLQQWCSSHEGIELVGIR